MFVRGRITINLLSGCDSYTSYMFIYIKLIADELFTLDLNFVLSRIAYIVYKRRHIVIEMNVSIEQRLQRFSRPRFIVFSNSPGKRAAIWARH